MSGNADSAKGDAKPSFSEANYKLILAMIKTVPPTAVDWAAVATELGGKEKSTRERFRLFRLKEGFAAVVSPPGPKAKATTTPVKGTPKTASKATPKSAKAVAATPTRAQKGKAKRGRMEKEEDDEDAEHEPIPKKARKEVGQEDSDLRIDQWIQAAASEPQPYVAAGDEEADEFDYAGENYAGGYVGEYAAPDAY